MSWASKVLGLCKKYGTSARFAATTILGIVPGGPAIVPLIEKVFEAAESVAQDEWELNLLDQVQLTAQEVELLNKTLDVLGGDLQTMMAQLAELSRMPDVADRLLEIARVNDSRVRSAVEELHCIALHCSSESSAAR